MNKIILDTNVIVSGILSKSYPHRILYELVAVQRVELLLSLIIFREYEDVFSRPKFSRILDFKKKADEVLQHISRVGIMHIPDITLDVIADKADNRFLELAIFAKADYIITGNTQDFTFDQYESVAIVQPAIYWQTVHQGNK